MKRFLKFLPLVLIVGYLLVHALVLSPVSLRLPWSRSTGGVFRGSLHRSGAFDSAGPASIVEMKASEPLHAFGKPALAVGAVCFGYGDGTLCCVDLATGRERWRCRPGFFPQSVVISGAAVISAGMEGQLAASDLAGGGICWKRIVAPIGSPAKRPQPAPTPAGRLLLADYFGDLYAIGTQRGNTQWAHSLHGSDASGIDVWRNAAYCTTHAGRLIAADLATGWELWRLPQPVAPAISWVRALDGLVCFAGDGYLHVLDASSGHERWSFQAPGNPAAISIRDGIARFGTGSAIRAVELSTGKQKWSVSAPAVATAAALSGASLYLATNDAAIFHLDAATGRKYWQARLGEPADSLHVEGRLLLASTALSSRATAIEIATGRPKWQLTGVMFVAAADDLLSFRDAEGCYHAVRAETGSEKWQFSPPACATSSPVVSGSLLCFGSADGYFCAVDIRTGQQTWRFSPQTGPVPSPAIYDGRGYFAAGCSLREWDFEGATRLLFTAPDLIRSAPAVLGGWAFFGCDDSFFYAISLAGDTKWNIRTGGPVLSSPAIVDRHAFFGSTDGHFYAVDAASGQLRWRYSTGGPVTASPAVAQGIAYVGSHDGRLYAIDAASGKRVWKRNTGDPIESSPALTDECVYVCSGRSLYCLDRATGDRRWKFNADDAIASSPAVFQQTVFITSTDGSIHAVDVQSGGNKWRFHSGAPIRSSPAVAGGIVYFGNDYEFLYALDSEDGKLLWRQEIPGGPISCSPVAEGGALFIVNGGRLFAIR